MTVLFLRCLSSLGQRTTESAARASLSEVDDPRTRSWSRSRTLSVTATQTGSVSFITTFLCVYLYINVQSTPIYGPNTDFSD